MVVCSCNLLTDEMIRKYMELHNGKPPSANCVMNAYGKSAVCATCAKTIKEEIRKHYESVSR